MLGPPYFGNDTGPHRSHGRSGEHAHQSQESVVGGFAHALAEAQILAEFLDGLGLIDIDAKNGKNFFDGSIGSFLARVVVATAVPFLHLFP